MLIDLLVSAVFGITMLFVLMFVVIWCAERVEPTFTLVTTKTGLKFSFKMGIYFGTVRLIRTDSATHPTARRGKDGWDCFFPKSFSNERMCEEIPHLMKTFVPDHGMHRKDLLIFDQVINKKNTPRSILGKIVITI